MRDVSAVADGVGYGLAGHVEAEVRLGFVVVADAGFGEYGDDVERAGVCEDRTDVIP